MGIMPFAVKLVLIASLLSHAVADDEHVKTLTDETFQSFVQSHEFVFVKFYAPWCGHCKALAPEFSAAADTLSKWNSRAVLAKVEASTERACGSTYDVKAYPTLVMFRWGEEVGKFGGERTETAMVDYVVSFTRESI